MSHYDRVVNRWLDRVMGRTTRNNLANPRLFGQGDMVYSYGHHFEVGRVLRDDKGNPRGFLLNGDRFSPTTDKHQRIVREYVRRENLPTVIIPYEALQAAGIEFSSVELIHATEDGHEEILHRTYEQPPGSVWRNVEIREDIPFTDDEVAAWVAKRNARDLADWEGTIARYKEWAGGDPNSHWLTILPPEPTPITVETVRPEYSWYLCHRRVVTGHRDVLYRSSLANAEIGVGTDGEGRTVYSWYSYRHWLGESIIRAKIPKRGFTACKSCTGTGRIHPDPLEAIGEYSEWRDANGLVDSETDRGTSPWGRPRGTHMEAYWDARHDAEVAGTCPTCEGRRGKHWTRRRTAYFISGFDHNEYPKRVYFFCELPKGVTPTTVDEAYDTLKPDTVKLAEQMDRTVHRQGDIFAIELLDVDKRSLRKQGATFEKGGFLLNTNHKASEVAHLPTGTTLVRGTLTHDPQWRGPDHKRVKVGKAWHVVLKNTVPLSV